ncbi:uncharacterized protein SOCE26_036330 [Sorangium cellulosum]|uniref:DUF4126 domain-containing protein n=1 Tax=Sorangium cellulosum TaxID=56 RepID=A0A2L0ESD2_SORCE|nr:DUF4126 family protein [Sorangium cellulosum]AUX42206.1 uncharacterized protein SOCE26_036330 [Sorangium cellulosum]
MDNAGFSGSVGRSRPAEIVLLGQAAGLGLVTGMRSMLGVKILAATARRGAFDGETGSFWHALRSPVAQRVLTVLAGGEFLMDKLPNAPSRLSKGPLVGRLAIGALLGAAVSARSPYRNTRIAGAVIGAAAAALGAFVGNRARTRADRGARTGETRVPAPVFGLIEDAIAFGVGIAAARR